MPLIPLPDGTIYHSRSLSHAFGTHSLQHFQAHGVHVELVPQSSKFVYVGIIDPIWRKQAQGASADLSQTGGHRCRWLIFPLDQLRERP